MAGVDTGLPCSSSTSPGIPPFPISQASVSTAPASSAWAPSLNLTASQNGHSHLLLGRVGDREGPAGKQTGVCRFGLWFLTRGCLVDSVLDREGKPTSRLVPETRWPP